MRWYDKPLSPAGRAAVMIAIGGGFIALSYTAPDGFVWVLRGAEYVTLRWFGVALIIYAIVKLTSALRVR